MENSGKMQFLSDLVDCRRFKGKKAVVIGGKCFDHERGLKCKDFKCRFYKK
jgi:hypothetical protein